MPATIQQALDANATGFYIGRRIIFPYRCQFIKVIFDNEVFTDFTGRADVIVEQGPENTSLHILGKGLLQKYAERFAKMKLIICEYDADLTDFHNHIKLVCEIGEKHEIRLRLPGDDVLFID